SYLIAALILQLMWSLRLAYKDIFALRNKKDLHTRDNLLFIVIVDWVSRSLCIFYCP
uniref:EXS domain-containing protein n=1 Tax=Aegilops tauschii subsp. strangulata TaxID=200361 RepID=A0A453GJD3_AEGTS